ncbi:DUF948 domain-containing protein [Virgibacillus sp. DJP39]|uniref:DUF948 domain-containing protein n=1 Tax=Virgibacillus sp. DJP39 TaxID=3409790 RepID=UPI003BB6C621
MENLLYIAAIIVAIAFAVLVIYLAMTLKATQRTLNNVADTVEDLEKQLQGITTETTALLNKTNRLAEDVEQKSSKLNGLFDGVRGIGETVKDFNQSLRKITTKVSVSAEQNQEKASQAVKWGTAMFDLWKKKKNNY